VDLIFEIFAWVYRKLLGDTEETANMQPDEKKGKRGPYDYGDQPRKPKTLEQIMEEVRREAAKAKVEKPAPQSNVIVPEKGKPRVELRSSFDEVASKPAPAPAPLSEPVAADAVPVVRKKARVEASPEDTRSPQGPAALTAIKAIEQKVAIASSFARAAIESSDAPAGPKVETTAQSLIAMLRTAPREQKLIAARQAIVLNEIFGPPRARRPLGRARIV